MMFADFSAHMGPHDRIVFFVVVSITIPADIDIRQGTDIIKIRFRFQVDVHILCNRKTGKNAQFIFFYDPLLIQMLLQVAFHILLMTAHKCNRQAIQACIAVFHMLARAEENDFREIIGIDADIDIAHDGKFRQKIHFYCRICPGRNDNMGIKFRKFCLQF